MEARVAVLNLLIHRLQMAGTLMHRDARLAQAQVASLAFIPKIICRGMVLRMIETQEHRKPLEPLEPDELDRMKFQRSSRMNIR